MASHDSRGTEDSARSKSAGPHLFLSSLRGLLSFLLFSVLFQRKMFALLTWPDGLQTLKDALYCWSSRFKDHSPCSRIPKRISWLIEPDSQNTVDIPMDHYSYYRCPNHYNIVGAAEIGRFNVVFVFSKICFSL